MCFMYKMVTTFKHSIYLKIVFATTKKTNILHYDLSITI